MHLNDDLGAPTLIHAARMDWAPSPASGVERRMLFRVGAEKARATSIVRYAPGSHFARHDHPGGEEFIVLEGTFQDETGDFAPGTYVRNPPGTAHAPGSRDGCVIFVKLWQFRSDDRARVIRRPGEGRAAATALPPGVASSSLLFAGMDERVMVEQWRDGTEVTLANPDGLELLVLDGSCTHGTACLDRWSWLRLPAGPPVHLRAGPDGTRVWYKLAPLLHATVCPMNTLAQSRA